MRIEEIKNVDRDICVIIEKCGIDRIIRKKNPPEKTREIPKRNAHCRAKEIKGQLKLEEMFKLSNGIKEIKSIASSTPNNKGKRKKGKKRKQPEKSKIASKINGGIKMNNSSIKKPMICQNGHNNTISDI